MERFPPGENPRSAKEGKDEKLGKNAVEDSKKNVTVERNIPFVSIIRTVKQEVMKSKAKNVGRNYINLRTSKFIL